MWPLLPVSFAIRVRPALSSGGLSLPYLFTKSKSKPMEMPSHPTVAAARALSLIIHNKSPSYRQEKKTGILPIPKRKILCALLISGPFASLLCDFKTRVDFMRAVSAKNRVSIFYTA